MLYRFAVVSTFVVDMLSLMLFGILFFKKRSERKGRNIVLFLLFAAVFCFCVRVTGKNPALKWLVLLFLWAGYYSSIYQAGFCRAYVVGALWQTISCLIEYVLTFLLWVSAEPYFPVILETEYNQVMCVMFGKEICLFLLMALVLKYRGYYVHFVESCSRREWWGLLVTSLVPLVFMTYTVQWYGFWGIERKEYILLLVTGIGIAVLYIFVFWLFGEMAKRNQQILLDGAIIGRIHNEISLYRSLAENIDRQQRAVHEYKHHLAAIAALLDSKEVEELKAYVAKAGESVKAMSDVLNTNHPIVNAILNTKYREAGEKHISMLFKIGDLSGLTVCEEDLVVILSNLLNNAVRAAEEGDKKIIKVKFVLENSRIILSVQNTYQGKIPENKGVFTTTKDDPYHEHGIGMKNVKECVEKYHGRYAIDYDEEYFKFSIVMENNR